MKTQRMNISQVARSEKEAYFKKIFFTMAATYNYNHVLTSSFPL